MGSDEHLSDDVLVLEDIPPRVHEAQQVVRNARGSLIGILFLTGFPILAPAVAAAICALFGQRLNEAHAPNIPWIGDLLYVMGLLGWLGIATIPLGVLCLPIAVIRYRRASRELVRIRAEVAEEERRFRW